MEQMKLSKTLWGFWAQNSESLFLDYRKYTLFSLQDLP